MSAFHVGFPPHILVLAQVVPGYDGDVAHAMATHFAGVGEHESRSDPSNFIYFAFSEYDVLAIVPLSEEGQLDRLTTFGHEHVRDLQQILCFPWTSGSANSGDLQPEPALTLTFLKLDEELVAKEGISAEHDVVRSLQQWIHKRRRTDGLSGLVLGTLGWPELLLMLTGNDLGELLNIARDLAITPIERPNKADLRFAFSHTLPCVRWDGNGKRFATESVDGQVSCQVLVSARPERLGQVIRKVRELPTNADRSSNAGGAHEPTVSLWDTEVAFGRRDLLVTPHDRYPVSIDRVVHLLSVLRSTEPGHQREDDEDPGVGMPASLITATHTQLSIPMPETVLSEAGDWRDLRQIPGRVARRLWIRLAPLLPFDLRRRLQRIQEDEATIRAEPEVLGWVLRIIDEFESWERRLGNPGLAHAGRLRQMLFRYQAVQNIPELQGIVDDMTEVLLRAVEDAVFLMGNTPLPPIPIVPYEVREAYDDFEEIANLFFYGLDQRLAGAVFGVSNPARAYTHLHALGVQRILCAADAIPRALLRLVRSYDGALEWPGFVVFGYCDETAKLVFNVLNMPYQDVALPSEWWRLAHEAGHACVDLQSFSDLSGFRAMEQQLKHSDLTDIAEDPTHLLDELAANVFEFEFAFRGHFDLYLRTVWRFFNRYFEGQEVGGKLTELLLRATFVFLYDLERQGILQPGETVESAIEKGKTAPVIPEERSMERTQSLRALGEYESLGALIKAEIIDRVEEAAPKLRHGIRRVPIEDVVERYCEFESWRTELVELFDQLRFENMRLPDLEHRLEGYCQSLEAGEILDAVPKRDLFLLPLALQYCRQALEDRGTGGAASISLRARIACALSLWHWGRKQTNSLSAENLA